MVNVRRNLANLPYSTVAYHNQRLNAMIQYSFGASCNNNLGKTGQLHVAHVVPCVSFTVMK